MRQSSLLFCIEIFSLTILSASVSSCTGKIGATASLTVADAGEESSIAILSDPDAGVCATPYDGGLDATAVAAGSQLVTQFNCKGCHQPTGSDGGVLSGRQTTIRGGYPANLTPDQSTGIGCLTNSALTAAILDGIGPNGALCGMPKYRAQLADGGVDPETMTAEIIEFLRSLPAVSSAIAGPCAAETDAATN
jgi:hypothetical protein